MFILRRILVIVFLLIFIPANNVFADGWFEGEYLTGNWGGHFKFISHGDIQWRTTAN